MEEPTDFTPEAWHALELGPLAAATYVMTASPSLLGVFSETSALAHGLQAAAAQAAPGTLVARLMATLDPHRQQTLLSEIRPKFGTAPEQTLAGLLAHVQAAGAALGAASPEDAEAYRQLVNGLSRAVAEAVKDEGVMVGPKEVKALEDIAAALGPA